MNALTATTNGGHDPMQAYLDDLLVEEDVPVVEENVPGPVMASEYYAFELTGMRLLIPAAAIDAVDKSPAGIAAAGGAGWLAGFATMEVGMLPVVDACRLLGLPGSALTADRPGALVKLTEGAGLIAVPAPGSLVAVETSTVTWRGPGGRRPWLAGVQAASRSVLLDVAGLATMLAAVACNTENTNDLPTDANVN